MAGAVVVVVFFLTIIGCALYITRKRRRARQRRDSEEALLTVFDSQQQSYELPHHTANAMMDATEITRPHTDVDAINVATATLLLKSTSSEEDAGVPAFATLEEVLAAGGTEDESTNLDVCEIRSILQIEPKKPTVGELDVEDPESKTVTLTLANVDKRARFVRYCLVGFGGRAFVVGLRSDDRKISTFKKVGVLAPTDCAEEVVVVHARCTTKTRPSVLVMAVTCDDPLAEARRSKRKRSGLGTLRAEKPRHNKATAILSVSALVKPHIKLDPSEIERARKIGEGSFGIVFESKWRGQRVAVKQFKMSGSVYSNAEWEELTKEAMMQANLRNTYVATLFGVVVDEMAMVTEFFPLGSLDKLLQNALDDKLRRPTELVSFALRVRFAIDIAYGMAFIIGSNLLHRDLKPGNVLVSDTNPRCATACCKLTDFGTARMIADRAATNANVTKGVGTPMFMAPEVLDPPGGRAVYSEFSEVYSYAIVLYFLFAVEEPFPYSKFTDQWRVPKFILSGERPDLRPLDEIVPERWRPDIADLITTCWAQVPEARCTFDAIVERLTPLLEAVLREEDEQLLASVDTTNEKYMTNPV